MTESRGSAREWRLYIVAAVAGVYVLAWSRIATQTPSAPAPAEWRVAERTRSVAPIPRRIRTRSS